MSALSLPGIVDQRWAAACASPSLAQWHSVMVWLEDFASSLAEHRSTAHLAIQALQKAAEARQKMRELMPEIEEVEA